MQPDVGNCRASFFDKFYISCCYNYFFAFRELRKYLLILRNRGRITSMKPQDIIVLIKLHLWSRGRWKIVPLAQSIHLSVSETHAAIKRLEKATLFDPVLEHPNRTNMEEFIIHGLKYVFPVEIGPQSRGIATAHSGPPLATIIVSNDNYVWPYAEGKTRGISIKPLYKTAPLAAQEDASLYEFLALIDCLRIGKSREQSLAKDELIKRIRGDSK